MAMTDPNTAPARGPGFYWVQFLNYQADVPTGIWEPFWWNGQAWQSGRSGMIAYHPVIIGPRIEPPQSSNEGGQG